MLSRRQVLHGGLGALATVLTPGARRLAFGGPPRFAPIDGSNRGSAPLVQLPRGLRSMRIDGLPYHRGMTGDPFPHPHMRFPSPASTTSTASSICTSTTGWTPARARWR